MTDLMARLYQLHKVGCPDARCAEAVAALSEAAAEIERLRNRISDLEEQLLRALGERR